MNRSGRYAAVQFADLMPPSLGFLANLVDSSFSRNHILKIFSQPRKQIYWLAAKREPETEGSEHGSIGCDAICIAPEQF